MIPVALVGAGRWGTNLARALQRLPQFDLRATCDPQHHGLGVAHYFVLSELLAHTDCEAVVIAVPPRHHADLARQALGAGKHVFVEKPMCMSTAEAVELRAACSNGSARLMVGHLLAYDPAFRALLRRVGRGASDAGVDVLVQRWSQRDGRDQRCPWWTMAPHDLSILRRLLPPPTRIRVRRNADGEVLAELEFGDGARAELSYRTDAARKVRRFVVEKAPLRWVLDDLGPHRLVEHTSAGARNIVVGCETPLDEELLHFAGAITNGTPFETGVEDGGAVVEMLEAGQRSLDAGGVWYSWPGVAVGGQC